MRPQNYLSARVDRARVRATVINFSAQTSAGATQAAIAGKLVKRKRGVYGPPIGTTCVVFVDDVSMPRREPYGAQPPVELLRQHLDGFPWYDRRELTPVRLQDVLVWCATGPPRPGNAVSPRFSRHFNAVAVNAFDDATMVSIFGELLRRHLDDQLSDGAGFLAGWLAGWLGAKCHCAFARCSAQYHVFNTLRHPVPVPVLRFRSTPVSTVSVLFFIFIFV